VKKKMKIGDQIRITKGDHKGKAGTIVSTRGSHVSNFVMVQLERLVQGHHCIGQLRSSDGVGIPVSNIEYKK